MTGANGFVGSVLCAALCRQAYTVVAADRFVKTPPSDVERVVVGAIDSTTDWSAALHKVEVIVHLAARVHVMKEIAADPMAEFRKTNVEGTLHLAQQAVKAGIKRFIYLSSIKVNGEQTETDKPFTEKTIVNPHEAYAISKLEAEQGLLEIAKQTGIEVVIIRPPLVYGAGVKANFANMLRMVKRGVPIPLGAIHNKRSFVYVDNLVSLIICCIHHPAAANQVFLVSDGFDLSTTELLRSCAIALGVKSRLVPIPQKWIEFCAAIMGKKEVAQRLCGNLQVDITKARTLLDWMPPVAVEAGLRATALGFKKVD